MRGQLLLMDTMGPMHAGMQDGGFILPLLIGVVVLLLLLILLAKVMSTLRT